MATFEEIKENEFNLNIPRYVDTFVEEEEVDITAVQKEIAELNAELVKTENGKNKTSLLKLKGSFPKRYVFQSGEIKSIPVNCKLVTNW